MIPILRCQLGGLASSAQTTSAQTQAHFFFPADDLGRLDISYPAVIGAPFGMAHVMAKLPSFTTAITFHN